MNRMNRLYPSLETCKKITHLFPETEMVIDEDGSIYIRERFSCTSCPNLAELIDRLPNCLYIYKRMNGKYMVKINGSPYNRKVNFRFINESLPEALGILLIKLDEEGLI